MNESVIEELSSLNDLIDRLLILIRYHSRPTGSLSSHFIKEMRPIDWFKKDNEINNETTL